MVCPNQAYQLESSLSCLVTQFHAVFHTGCHSPEQGLTSLSWQDVKQVQTKTWVATCTCYVMMLHMYLGTVLHPQNLAPAVPSQGAAQAGLKELRARSQERALPSSGCRDPALDPCSYTNGKLLSQHHVQKPEGGCTQKR